MKNTIITACLLSATILGIYFLINSDVSQTYQYTETEVIIDDSHESEITYQYTETEDIMERYEKELELTDSLKNELFQMIVYDDIPIETCEKWVIELIEKQNIGLETSSELIKILITHSSEKGIFRFEKLQAIEYLKVVSSEDNKVISYVWTSGYCYNCSGYLVLTNDGERAYAYDLVKCISNYPKELDVCHYFRIKTIDLNGKRYYLFDTNGLQASATYSSRFLAIYSIEGHNRLIAHRLFRDSNEEFCEICLEFQGVSNEEDYDFRSFIFEYIPETQTIKVPLYCEENPDILSNEYESYVWDGKYFTLKEEKETKTNF